MDEINLQTQNSPHLTPKFRSLVSAPPKCVSSYFRLLRRTTQAASGAHFFAPQTDPPCMRAPRRQQRTMDSLCRTIKFRRLRNRISEILARRFHIFIGPRRAGVIARQFGIRKHFLSILLAKIGVACVRISIELEAHFVAHKLTLTTFQIPNPSFSQMHLRRLSLPLFR